MIRGGVPYRLLARKLWKGLKVVVPVAGGLYLVLSAALFAIMLQPPGRISSVFKRLHWTVFATLPMETLWLRAREGGLRVGDSAPDFDLSTFDKKSRVRLASLRGMPVVLVFGSYT